MANAFGWGNRRAKHFSPCPAERPRDVGHHAGLSLMVLMVTLNLSAGVAGHILGQVKLTDGAHGTCVASDQSPRLDAQTCRGTLRRIGNWQKLDEVDREPGAIKARLRYECATIVAPRLAKELKSAGSPTSRMCNIDKAGSFSPRRPSVRLSLGKRHPPKMVSPPLRTHRGMRGEVFLSYLDRGKWDAQHRGMKDMMIYINPL